MISQTKNHHLERNKKHFRTVEIEHWIFFLRQKKTISSGVEVTVELVDEQSSYL